jgi:hypothetical protein
MAHGRTQHKALFSTGKTGFDNMSLSYQPRIMTVTIKRNLLENAVGQVQELRPIKTQAAQHKTQNDGIEFTYAQYCSLLSSAAQEYDGSLVRSVKTAQSAARRSIYYTEFEPRKIEDNFFDVAYDIDTSPNDILEVNVHGFGGPRLNADQWGCLPKEAQEKWDQLDQASKAIILEHKLSPPQAALCKALLRATLEGPLEALLPPGTAQLTLQSTYVKSVRQNTWLTAIRCPLMKPLMTIK